jgi:hypothetical protein
MKEKKQLKISSRPVTIPSSAETISSIEQTGQSRVIDHAEKVEQKTIHQYL